MARRAGIPGARKVSLNMKTTPDFRAKLEALASASGRTLSHEVEYQLERAVMADDLTRAIRETIRQEMRAEFEARKPPVIYDRLMTEDGTVVLDTINGVYAGEKAN